MSYVNHAGQFAPSQIREIDFSTGIIELTDDETAMVNGGLAPLAWAGALALRCAANAACRNSVKVGALAVAGAAAAYVGYENNRE
ncbi:MAG: hypothetical protein HEQ22_08475 [Sphingopyxis sp.]|uniref:hypothetical protein n=1 Tax=Sphingopyxis sp. TaxID=1908224 RepID=UPI003D80F2E2